MRSGGLIRAELRRLFSRRMTRLLLALVVALMATVAVVTAVNHQRPGPGAVAAAEAAAEREFQQQQRFIEQDIDACEQAQAAGTPSERSGWPEDCQEIRQFYPTQEDMVEWHMPPAFDFRDGFRPMITVFAALLGLFAFLVGASFVGAEWRSGGMMNLLLWRPRRLQVLGAKLLALLGSLLGIGLLGGAAWTGAFWLVARFRGVTDTMTAGTWQSFGLSGVRGLVLALVAGGLGFALASLGRHTAMAMGVAIAAFVVGIAGVGIIAGGMLQLPFFEQWLWTTYVNAWMDGSVELIDWNAPCTPTSGGEFGECESPRKEITWRPAGLGIGAVVALVLGAAMWQIRSRDVT